MGTATMDELLEGYAAALRERAEAERQVHAADKRALELEDALAERGVDVEAFLGELEARRRAAHGDFSQARRRGTGRCG